MKHFLLLSLILVFSISIVAQKIMTEANFDESSVKINKVDFSETKDYQTSPDWNWMNKFGGGAGSTVRDIIQDSQGNIYICGDYSGLININEIEFISVGLYQAYVAKVSATGDLEWFSDIETSEGNTSKAFAIDTTNTGNLLFTGYYSGGATFGAIDLTDDAGYTLFIGEIDKDGNPVRAIKHGTGSSTYEIGLALDVDNSDNVYVVGSTDTYTGWRHETVLLKYNAAGILQWQKYEDESFNDVLFSNSSVYYTGMIESNDDGDLGGIVTDIQISDPYQTNIYASAFFAKVNTSGTFESVNICKNAYTRGLDVEIGDSYGQKLLDNGNIFLVGFFGGDMAIGSDTLFSSDRTSFIAQCNTDGTLSGGLKLGYGVAVKDAKLDDNGKIYILSSTSDLLILTSEGAVESTIDLEYLPRTIASNSGLGTLIAGDDDHSLFIAEYDVQETKLLNSSSDYAITDIIGLTTDNNGFVYSFGISNDSSKFMGQEIPEGIFIAKQNASGDLIWIKRIEGESDDFNTSGGGFNYIEISKNNQDIYLAISFNSEILVEDLGVVTPATNGAFLVASYSIDGDLNWIETVDLTEVAVPYIDTDYKGNIIVSGTFTGGVINGVSYNNIDASDVFILKYNSSGSLLWHQVAGGENTEYIGMIASDSYNNIYLVGEFLSENIQFGTETFQLTEGAGNIVFVKLDESGNMLWQKSLCSGKNEGNSWPTSIETDFENNIVIKGWYGDSVLLGDSILSCPYSNYNHSKFICKANPDGEILWVNTIYETEGLNWDYNQMAVDRLGNIYYALELDEGNIYFGSDYIHMVVGSEDLLLAKYNKNGVLQYLKSIPTNGSIKHKALAVYDTINIYVGGQFSTDISFDGDNLYTASINGFIAMLGESANYPPQNIIISNNEIAENSKIGIAIGTLETMDSNPDDEHTYTFEGNTKNILSENLFYIGSDTLYVGDTLDYESTNSFWVYIQVTDTEGKTLIDSILINITDANDAPIVASPIPDQITRENEPFEFIFDQNSFTDQDAGDLLEYTISLTDESALPSWLTFNSSTRTFSGTPPEMDLKSIKVTAEDVEGITASDDFMLVIEGYDEVTEEEILVDTTSSDDVVTVTIPETVFIDMGLGDDITYTASLADGSPLPSYIVFDPETLTFTITLNNKKSYKEILAELDIIVTGVDSDGYTATVGFSIEGAFLSDRLDIYINLKVYPNPVKDKLIIENKQNSPLYLEIYDLTGKLVKNEFLTGEKTEVDLSSLEASVYLLKLTNQGEIRVLKILKN